MRRTMALQVGWTDVAASRGMFRFVLKVLGPRSAPPDRHYPILLRHSGRGCAADHVAGAPAAGGAWSGKPSRLAVAHAKASSGFIR